MKNKLLYVSDVLFSGTSGELTHTVGLLNAFVYKGYDVTYLTHKTNYEILEEYNISKKITFIFFQFNSVKILSKIMYNFKVYSHFISSNEFDLVYIRETFYSIFLIPFILFKRFKVVTFLEFNGVRYIEESGLIKNIIIKTTDIFSSYLYKKVSHNIAVSNGIKELLKDRYNLTNVTAINNASDLQINVNETNCLKKNSIVFIGNLSSWQNFDLLVNTILKNKEQLLNMNYTVDIYGDGKEKTRIEKLIESNNLKDIIMLHGRIQKNQIAMLLKNSKLGLLIDKRFYKGYYLFSPLKYYEYSSVNLKSILLIENNKINEKLDGVYICNSNNFIEQVQEAVDSEIILKDRTWIDVVNEIEVLYK